MAGWFAKLMQKGHPRSHRAIAGAAPPTNADVGSNGSARDARYDAIVQMLRDRAVEDRQAREKRQRWYSQHLKSESGLASNAPTPGSPTRLHKFNTKVPCRATPEARALLDELRKRFSGSTVTFPEVTSRQQVVMLTRGAGAEPLQIGRVEHSVQTDPRLCHVRHQGLTVETDGGSMLVLRFRYPATAVRVSSKQDAGAAGVDFTEIRPALDLRPSDKGPSPRLVWLTRPEVEAMNAVGSRDYEAFYVRFKLEVLAGIWSSLSAVLSGASGSQWHEGSYYTVVRESDATTGKIHQKAIDDSGRAADIGSDRVYDAFPATDILLLHLDGDILADVADIYFTLQSLGSSDAYFLKEEFFTVIRRFWAGSQSLVSRFGSHLPAVVRMSQRALPMPAQAPLLKQDWTNLRQSLVDRYGDGGRKAADLAGQDVHRPRSGPLGWPFASFPAGEVNVGLRLVYRQEWSHLGAQRGDAITPRTQSSVGAEDARIAETTIVPGDTTRNLDEFVDEVVNATVDAMKWPLDFEGSINTGVRGLAATTDMGLESECCESSRDTSTRLTEIMQRMAGKFRDETVRPVSAEPEEGREPQAGVESFAAAGTDEPPDQDAPTYVCSSLQNRYEILTRPAEIQNVVLVAERLPTPAEIDRSWVRRHDWILARVLLDESFRDALETIGRDQPEGQPEDFQRDLEPDAKRDRLYEHLRANILHYQRAIWQQEDRQQRSMRYRKSGKKVPLEWRFELESGGALTIDELGDRLAATSVDGQFAAYSAGREADLDQVIDPSGPIGYYGNYAIYHMRPEFGSEDLFSMLHFFKSPYLRPNPETGEPEVDDPMLIQLAEDPVVVGAGDDAIERHRDEMFEYVPELRLELARALEKVSDGTDARAVDRLERHPGVLRHHFATYLFRRERTRRITLDTDGLVIDVIRPVVAATSSERHDGDVDLREALDGCHLILEGGQDIDLLIANGHRDAEAAWAILRDGGAAVPNLLAGARGGAEQGHERVIRSEDGEERAVGLSAGRAHDPQTERVILAREDGGSMLTAIGGGAAQAPEPVIRARGDEARMSSMPAGRAHQPDAERVILARDDGALTLTSAAEAPPAHERVILARDDEWLRPSPVAQSQYDPDPNPIC